MTLTTPASAATETRTTPPAAPAATRSRRPGWRDPRLLLGLVLVAGSVVLGARLLASADDTVGVWAVSRDLPAGATVAEGDLVQRRVRFPDPATADAYLSSTDRAPTGSTLDRAVDAGELLPRAALGRPGRSDLVEVPLSVAEDDLPATVRQGSVVDVWVAPDAGTVSARSAGQDDPTGRAGQAGQVGQGDLGPQAARVLSDVTVVAVPGSADSLAPRATRQVIVGVPADRADDLGAALGGVSQGRVVIARKG